MFSKKLCSQCNLNGECCCQKSQKEVDNCGMEQVISYNENYQQQLKSGTLTYGSLKE